MLQLGEKQKAVLGKVLSPKVKFLLKRLQLKFSEIGELDRWEKSGRPNPPPHRIKQKIIQSYQEKYGLSILVETGTFVGNMIHAQKNHFQKIYSIELDVELHKAAQDRFRSYPHIHLIQGDSGVEMNKLIPHLKSKTLFWLDGHYSGGFTARGEKDCPIYGELDAIFSSASEHVILIDDARCFDGTQDYPTISELEHYIAQKNPQLRLNVETDVIRIVPQ